MADVPELGEVEMSSGEACPARCVKGVSDGGAKKVVMPSPSAKEVQVVRREGRESAVPCHGPYEAG